MWLGIDFGTCYSSAAFILDGTLERVKDPRKLGYSFPSSVYVGEQEEILVGHAADYQRNKDPNRYRREFKRDLGRDIPYQLGDRHFLPEDLVAEVLRRLKSEADRTIEAHAREPFAAAVIAIPATYQEHKRRLMRQAAQKAGFTQVELLEEPVATAIYYAQRYNIQEGEIVLVYDLGGGTFDATLMQKQGAGYKLLTMPMGLEHCGGIDFDRLIYQDLKQHCGTTLAELLEPQRRDVEALRARLMVSDWCREVKHQLGEVTEFEDMLPGFFSEFYHLSRETFNGMIKRYIDETIQLCQQLIKDAGSDWEKLNRVLLVGGSCRIPYVQQALEQELQRPVFRADEPELAICMGAALRGASLDAEKEADVYVSRGMARFVIADFQGAIENCDRALQINPSSAKAYCNRGLARYKLGEYQAAIADYDQALQISSDLTFAYHSRGLARTEIKDYTGAIEDFNRAGIIPNFEVAKSELEPEMEPEIIPINKELESERRELKELIVERIEKPSIFREILDEEIPKLSNKSVDEEILSISIERPVPKSQWQEAIKEGKYNLENVSLVHTLTGHTQNVNAIAISPDEQMLVSCSTDKTIKIWELNTGNLLRSIFAHEWAVSSIALSPDGQMLVSCSRNEIKIWELNTGNLLRSIFSDEWAVSSIALSPDGQMLVSCGCRGIKIWELNTGNLLHTLTKYKDCNMRLSICSDGQTLASGFNESIMIWNLNTGRWLGCLFRGHTRRVDAIAISPDGQTLVSGSHDKTIKIWKLNTEKISSMGIQVSDNDSFFISDHEIGKVHRVLKGHTDSVCTLAISPNGQTLVSGSRDSNIKIWKMATGELLHSLSGHRLWITSVAISSNGQTLVSSSNDKTIKIWRTQ